MLELEVLVLLADAALAKRYQLLALGERTHRDGPFLESDRHWWSYLFRSMYGLEGAVERPCDRWNHPRGAGL